MEEKQAVKIAVCVPWDSPFMWMVPAFNMMNWDRPQGSEVAFFPGVGWCPAARHNDAVGKAQAWGADLIVFNGGDHVCPFDILVSMLARINEGWDMVHAMPPGRGVCGHEEKPFKAVAYKMTDNAKAPIENAVLHMPTGSSEMIGYEDEPQQTHVCGTGNIMMKAGIFNGLEKPYFTEFIKKDGLYGRWCVMDSDFVYRCTVLCGARMITDTSIHIIHLDVFGIDETYSERFKDKTGQMDWSPAKDYRKFAWPTGK
jgi:hypothetical protein